MQENKKQTDQFSNLLRAGLTKREIMDAMDLKHQEYQNICDRLLQSYTYNFEISKDSVSNSTKWDKEAYRLASRLGTIKRAKYKLFEKYRDLYNLHGFKLERRKVAKKIKAFNDYEVYYTNLYKPHLSAVKLSDPFYQH